MSDQSLFRNYYQLLQGIEASIENNQLLPALILIYTGIDSVAWLSNSDPQVGVGKRFKRWVNSWMLEKHPLDCTAEELYAARCGLLHTLTPTSDLSESGGVRQIAYSWGAAKSAKLREAISALSKQGEIASIHVQDLHWAFRQGMADYLDYVFADQKRRSRFLRKSGLHFASLEMEKVDEFLEAARSRA